MGMAAPVIPKRADDALDRPEPPSAAYLASQVWTADRVRHELIDEQWPAPRYEFVGGMLLVSPSPAYPHQVALRELYDVLGPYVRAHGLGEVAWSPSDVEVLPNTTAQPDLFVIPPGEARRVRAPGYRPIHRLLLAIEVLSPGSWRKDRVIKREHYLRAGVPQYWVVDPLTRVFEVSEPGAPDRYQLCTREVAWHPAGAPGPLVINVPAYFERVLGVGGGPDTAVVTED